MALLIVALVAGAPGCSGIPIRGSDSNHYLVIGLGLLSVPRTEGRSALEITRVHALGLTASDRPGLRASAGLASSLTVMVPDGAEDVRVDVSSLPFGDLRIVVPAALLEKEPRNE